MNHFLLLNDTLDVEPGSLLTGVLLPIQKQLKRSQVGRLCQQR